MLKQKLLERALSMLLSISMVFGSMPTTVHAAEHVEDGTVEEAVFEESSVDETSETSTVQETEIFAEIADIDDNNIVETETTTQAETEPISDVIEISRQVTRTAPTICTAGKKSAQSVMPEPEK